ncbi:MAG: hypothetical protein JJU10_06450 [Idiomarina sp.]|nr:hypothetical protein [Idiomarina sp.]
MNPRMGLLFIAVFLSGFSLPALSGSASFPECDAASIGGPCTPLMPSITQAERSGTTINLQWNSNSDYDYFLLGQSLNGSWGADQQVVY